MICVARRITAVERTERFSTRHELSGKLILFFTSISVFSDLTLNQYNVNIWAGKNISVEMRADKRWIKAQTTAMFLFF